MSEEERASIVLDDKNRNDIVRFLVVAITVGFFSLLGVLAFHEVPNSSHDLFIAMVGSLGSSWLVIVGYFFGSSASSANKDKMLAKKDVVE